MHMHRHTQVHMGTHTHMGTHKHGYTCTWAGIHMGTHEYTHTAHSGLPCLSVLCPNLLNEALFTSQVLQGQGIPGCVCCECTFCVCFYAKTLQHQAGACESCSETFLEQGRPCAHPGHCVCARLSLEGASRGCGPSPVLPGLSNRPMPARAPGPGCLVLAIPAPS